VAFRALLIGDALVDVTLSGGSSPAKMRLGGIIHAARGLWALKAAYEIAFIAPSNLIDQVMHYALAHGASRADVLGIVTGAPNVVVIGEPKEVGFQEYELLLRDEYKCTFELATLSSKFKEQFTDILIFPGQYDLEVVLRACSKTKARIHIDIANGLRSLHELDAFSRPFETIITSTSSPLFLGSFRDSPERMAKELVGKKCQRFVFKENRGGARLFDSKSVVEVGAQLRPITHSVGVGDCFDVAYVYMVSTSDVVAALCYASFVAADYAGTTYVDDFKRAVQDSLSNSPEAIVRLQGVRIPWERRPAIHVYIAAPDFDFVDRTPIDSICESLRYHNFTPHRPIEEHGQMGKDLSPTRRQELFNRDVELLERCQIVVAVLLYDDPGTLIEIGLAAAAKKRVLVFAPRGAPENLMLTQLPQLVTQRQDELIDGVFRAVAELLAHEKDG